MRHNPSDTRKGNAMNKTKVVNGKTYVLYAGRWHVKVEVERPLFHGATCACPPCQAVTGGN